MKVINSSNIFYINRTLTNIIKCIPTIYIWSANTVVYFVTAVEWKPHNFKNFLLNVTYKFYLKILKELSISQALPIHCYQVRWRSRWAITACSGRWSGSRRWRRSSWLPNSRRKAYVSVWIFWYFIKFNILSYISRIFLSFFVLTQSH